MTTCFATCLVADARAQATRVQLEAPDGARLERRAVGERWETVCVAPCEAGIDSGGDFRVTGDRIRDSEPFTLRGEPGERAKIRVDGASKGGFVAGIVMLGVGGAAVAVPLLYLTSNVVMHQSEGPAEGPSSETLTGLLVAIGVGVAVGGIGLSLLLSNRQTAVSQEIAATRRPSWKPVDRASVGSSLVAIPILQGTF
jgi:hypothetical protein